MVHSSQPNNEVYSRLFQFLVVRHNEVVPFHYALESWQHSAVLPCMGLEQRFKVLTIETRNHSLPSK